MKMFDDTTKKEKARELTRMERKQDRMTGATGKSFNNFKMGFMMGSNEELWKKMKECFRLVLFLF